MECIKLIKSMLCSQSFQLRSRSRANCILHFWTNFLLRMSQNDALNNKMETKWNDAMRFEISFNNNSNLNSSKVCIVFYILPKLENCARDHCESNRKHVEMFSLPTEASLWRWYHEGLPWKLQNVLYPQYYLGNQYLKICL